MHGRIDDGGGLMDGLTGFNLENTLESQGFVDDLYVTR